jgi:hypothetical protein
MNTIRINEFFCLWFRNPYQSDQNLARYVQQLEQSSSYRVCEHWKSEGGRVVIINVQVKALQGSSYRLSPGPSNGLPANRIRRSRGIAWIRAGYTTSATTDWEANLRLTGHRLSCKDSGGVAAFCAATSSQEDDEAIYLWSSRPSIRPIAIAQNKHCIIAGTRPLLVHRLASDDGSVHLDQSYIINSLAGWSLGNHTPYEGTSLLPVDSLVCIRKGMISEHPHPTPIHITTPPKSLRSQRNIFSSTLRQAVEPLRDLPGFELRLSGGKDSRLLAAAIYYSNINPSTVVCHGIPGEWETPIALRVAEALGWQINFVVPEYAFLGSEHASVRYNLSVADGFLATEPLQSAYPQFGISGDRGPGLSLGHLSLHRGGWADRMRVSHSKAMLVAKAKLLPLRDCVDSALIEQIENQIDNYLTSLDISCAAGMLFWSNYRYRVCRWMTGHYLLHSRWLLPIYPLVDEKVVRLLCSTPLQHLASESLVFAAMSKMAPQLIPIPLFLDRYRFEAKEEHQRFSTGYQQREPLATTKTTYIKKEILMSGNISNTLCDHIRNGSLRALIKELSTSAIWSIIENPSESLIATSEIPRRTICSYLWTCYQASILHTDGLISL